MSWHIYQNGTLRERGDDETRTVTTYDDAGEIVETRPYTADQTMDAERIAAAAARQQELDALLDEIARIDTALAAEDARIQPCLDDGPQTINAGPAVYIKHNARALKRVIKAARDLANVIRDNQA